MNNRLILLVEDNPDDEALTLRAFGKIQIANQVRVARDGAEALDYSPRGDYLMKCKSEDLPAVILLDLKLPKVDGLEVLKRVRADEHTQRIPVVVLTSSQEEQDYSPRGDVISSYHFGANSYIRKPVSFEQFFDAVHRLGFYWLLLNESPHRRGV
jgi:two-component system response regulator